MLAENETESRNVEPIIQINEEEQKLEENSFSEKMEITEVDDIQNDDVEEEGEKRGEETGNEEDDDDDEEEEDDPLAKIIATPLPTKEEEDTSIMGRKRKRNKKYDSVNYEETHIEGVDSDMDVDVLKDSESEEEAKPKRSSSRRSKGADPHRQGHNDSKKSHSYMVNTVTTRMENIGDSNYTLTDGVPDWVDFDVGYEECGSRILETVYARRKIDRTLPNNGIVIKSGHLSSKAVSISPNKSKLGGVKIIDQEEDENDDEDDNVIDEITENVFDSRYEYEYQCKFKGRSHIHLEWVSCEDLETLSHKAKQHIYRYLKKLQSDKDEGEGEDEPYVEIWEVERILAHRTYEEDIPDMSKMPKAEEELETPKMEQDQVVTQAAVSSTLDPSQQQVVTQQLRAETPTYSVGDLVDVARHDRNGKTCFGGVGLVTLAHPPQEGETSFTYDVRYVVGGGGVTKVDENMLKLQDDTPGTRNGGTLSASDSSAGSRSTRKTNKTNEDDEINKSLTLLDRCSFLLERFETDALCEPFLAPVDVRSFPDYEDIVDNPMDLGTVRRKLQSGGNKGYREDSAFIRDMRLIWTNCKKYNHRDAAIWHTADALQKTCERLFQAWVMAFAPPANGDPIGDTRNGRSKRISLANQKFDYKLCKNKKRRGAYARPWEQSCRFCEDPTESEEPVLLCDHCDAQYHLGCTSPRLSKLPEYAWLCPVCANEPHKGRSASVEDAAMKKMDIASLPTIVVKKEEFLVKWVGKGYSYCSWESPKDIDNKAMIDAFMSQSGTQVLASQVALFDEPTIPYSRMIKEFHDGFERSIGNKVFRDPFKAPVLKAAAPIPYHKHVGKIPMPLLDPSWVVRHDVPPPPVASKAVNILAQYSTRDDETPMRNIRSSVYAQIRLAHYLNHMSPVSAVAKASAQMERDELEEKEKENKKNEMKDEDVENDEIKKDDVDGGDVTPIVDEKKEFQGPLPRHFLLASGTSTSGLAFLARRREEAEKAGQPPPVETIVETSVANLLGELVEHVIRGDRPTPPGPPLRTGEYDVCIPKLETGFHLNIHDDDGAVKVASFRPLPNDEFPPAAVVGVSPGDTMVRINGTSISSTSFGGICQMLGELDKGFVYLRFLRRGIEAEIRPDMLVVHRARPEIKTPGEASSKFRGVFRRDDIWEVAICLHPTFPNPKMTPTRTPPSLYLVMACSEDEEDAAIQYDQHLASLSANMTLFSWPHLGGRRMNVFEVQAYYPRRLTFNFGPHGYYEIFKEEGWNAGVRASRPQKPPKVKHGDDSDYDDAPSFDEESSSSESDDDDDDDELDDDEPIQNKKAEVPEVFYSLAECGLQLDESSFSLSSSSSSSSSSAQANEKDITKTITQDEGSPTKESVQNDEPTEAKLESGDEEDEEEDDKMKVVKANDDMESLAVSVSKTGGAQTGGAKALAKLSKKLAVKESTWLEAGHMEKLLLATHRSSQRPVSDDWFATGLPVIEDETALQETEEERMDEDEPSTTGLAPGETKVARQVVQRDLDSGKVLRIWPSSTAAAKHFSVPYLKMQEACKSNGELCGFKWESFGQFGDTAAVDEETMQKRREDGVFQYAESREYKGGNKLRDYQLNGLNWLLLCHHYKRSCILADEMGLGKTVQVVTFLEHLLTVDKMRGPYLIIVPLSTVGHWEREFKGWTDMQVCVYHDQGKDTRALIRAFEWYFDGRAPYPPGTGRVKFEVLITTYDEVIKDMEQLGSIPWRGLIVDEAHRLKGISSKLLECLHQIMPLGVQRHGTQHRLLMTGTPLQNNTKELWSLLNFIEPSKFPSLENFQETYEGMDSEYQVRSLQQRLAPHLLRRVKEDVATDIPAKYETVIDVELTTLQKQYYRAIFEKNQSFLARAAKGAAVPKLMNIQMELRKCCNHPYLIDGVEEREIELLNEELSNENNGLVVTDAVFKKAWLERCLLQSSGKLVLLDKLLPKLRREGHKVLIFSQMTRVLNILEDFCEHRSFKSERLDGSVTGSMRQAAIDRFNNDEDSFVFLLSTRAGGVGINLTAADTCIIFDSDWNPQNDVQAQARCHRIGQTKEVMVYRLITRKSFEAEMFDRASVKLGLERAVLGTRDFDGGDEGEDGNGISGNGDIKLSQSEMEKLLRQGAYALMEDDQEGDAVAAAFCEGDIDSILEERSRVRKIESGQTAGWLNKKSKLPGLQNRVTKSSFTAEGAADNKDVNVDDPNFWAKVLPDMKNAAVLKDQLSALLSNEDKNREEVDRIVKDVKSITIEVMERVNKGKKLAEVERKDLQDLLFRLSLCGDLIGEENRAYAESMHLALEGKRRRTTATTFGQSLTDGNNSNQNNSSSSRQNARKLAKESKKLLDMAKGKSLVTNRNFKSKNDDYEGSEEDDDLDDDDDELIDEDDIDGEILLDDDVGGKQKQPGKKRKVVGKKKASNKPSLSSSKLTKTTKPKLSKTSSKKEETFQVGDKQLRRSSSKKSVYADSGSEQTDEDDLLPAYGSNGNGSNQVESTQITNVNSSASSSSSSSSNGQNDVKDEDYFELECGKCGDWFLNKEVGITRKMAENFSEWFCSGCDDSRPTPSSSTQELNTATKPKRKKKSSLKEGNQQGDEDDDIDSTSPKSSKKSKKDQEKKDDEDDKLHGMAYITCDPWPQWKDIPNHKALNTFCIAFIDELFLDEDVEDIFGFPVPEDTPGYSVLIQHPMDLGTMYEKAEKGEYKRLIDFRNDLELVVNNCLTFNIDGSEFFKMAQDLATSIPGVYEKLTQA